jgi:NADH-quinone oxidoreductase subunit I
MAGWFKKTMIPDVYVGLKTTFKHMIQPKRNVITPTIQYPEEKAPTFKRTRGVHYMKTDDDGRANCVACFMCSTACPANAITIVQKEAPAEWEGRDTYPETFVVDELRCIFCGMCEEACPKDAIHLSNTHAPVFHDRSEAIYDLDRLMKHYNDVKETGEVQFTDKS